MRLKISIRNKKGEDLFPVSETGVFNVGDSGTISFNIKPGITDQLSKSSKKEALTMLRRMVMNEIDVILIEGVE